MLYTSSSQAFHPFAFLSDSFPQIVDVKIGTASILTPRGDAVDEAVLYSLSHQLMRLARIGHRPILITSGAVGLGRAELGYNPFRKLSDREKAVAASIGQPILMAYYRDAFKRVGLRAASQALLENKHLETVGDEHQYNLIDYIHTCLALPGVIPVLNENDVVSRVEIKLANEKDPWSFSDNDGLRRCISDLINIPIGVTISTDCIHTCDPRDPLARPIPYINFASKVANPHRLGISTDGVSNGGTGGMGGKIEEIRKDLQSALCGGRRHHVISINELLDDGLIKAVQGKKVGTELTCWHSKADRGYGPCPGKIFGSCTKG